MLEIANNLLWSTAIILLLGGGLFFTIRLKGPQFRFIQMIKSFKTKETSKISPFKSLTMALAARIGVGSLAGIALAIYIGGPGSIFWIWVSSIITSVNAFSESCLGTIYREKDGDLYKGGPAFYMDKGLNRKFLAKVYALLIIVAYVFGFMTIQANTIVKSVQDYYQIPPIITGVVLAIIAGIIILKGVKGIVDVTSKLVPVMGIAYIILSVIVITTNLDKMPGVLSTIVGSAFNFKAAGAGLLTTFIIGIQRGVFSTEAGLGSGAIASSTADTNNPSGLGLIQILGIHFTSFIICTSTAFMILTSNYKELNLTDINGIEITQYALNFHLGNIGIIILVLSIISFAFSTIIAGYYYGESNLKYLDKNVTKTKLIILKLVTIAMLIFGSVASPSILWSIVDILVAFMAILNMYAVIGLRKDVEMEWNYYQKKNKL